MITKELINYIEKKLNQNTPKENIKANLVQVGWHFADIEEGFLEVNQKTKESTSQKTIYYKNDPYLERPDESENSVLFENDKAKEGEEAQIKKEEQIFSNMVNNNKDSGKIWIPKAIKPNEDRVEFSLEKELEIRPEELTGVNDNPPKELSRDPLSFYKEKISQASIVKKDSIKPSKEDIKQEKSNEENIPKLIPKNQNASLSKIENISTSLESKENKSSLYGGSLSKSAMIYSYSSDLMTANNLNQKNQKPKKNKVVRFFMILISILLLIAILGLIFVLSKISLNFNFSNFF